MGTVSSDAFGITPQAPPAARLMGSSPIRSTVSYYANRGHNRSNSTVSATVLDNTFRADQKYLLICFSTKKSEIFKQIDVTAFGNDQTLLDNLRLVYLAIKREESWISKIPLLRAEKIPSWLYSCLDDLHLYKPKKINFVSVSNMIFIPGSSSTHKRGVSYPSGILNAVLPIVSR